MTRPRLLAFLSVAAFFEGFDFLALAQVLPQIREEFALSKAGAGALFAVVNIGTILAWFLVRRADAIGRRRTLMVTILGYAVATAVTGLATNVWWFAGAQLVARMFLLAEYATSVIYASEEYPADRRGFAIGMIQGASSLGSVACAGLTPLLVQAPWGWRTVYFAGIVPLLLLSWARRSLPETARFLALPAEQRRPRPPFAILGGPSRTVLLRLGLIWMLTYTCSNTAVSFWKDFAMGERGLTEAQVGWSLAAASLVSMPLVFLSGRLLDRWGRRRGAVLIYAVTAVGVVGSYGVHGHGALTVAMTLAIFGVSAVLPVLNAFTTELVPTAQRGEAMGVANNLLGRVGYVIAPWLVGRAAEATSWGAAMRPTAISLLVALILILCWLPETAGRELDEGDSGPVS